MDPRTRNRFRDMPQIRMLHKAAFVWPSFWVQRIAVPNAEYQQTCVAPKLFRKGFQAVSLRNFRILAGGAQGRAPKLFCFSSPGIGTCAKIITFSSTGIEPYATINTFSSPGIGSRAKIETRNFPVLVLITKLAIFWPGTGAPRYQFQY